MNRGDDALRLPAHLPVAEMQHVTSKGTKIEIAGPVVLEGLASPVVAKAIGFDDQSSLAPEEVNEMWADANVDLRRWQPVPLAQSQEIPLELAARPVARGFGADRQAEDVRLPDRTTQFFWRYSAPQVGDRLRRLGYGDSMSTRDGSGLKGDSAMYTKPHSPGPTRAA